MIITGPPLLVDFHSSSDPVAQRNKSSGERELRPGYSCLGQLNRWTLIWGRFFFVKLSSCFARIVFPQQFGPIACTTLCSSTRDKRPFRVSVRGISPSVTSGG